MKEAIQDGIRRLVEGGAMSDAEAPFLEEAASHLYQARPVEETDVLLSIVANAMSYAPSWVASKAVKEADREYEEALGHPPPPSPPPTRPEVAQEAARLPELLAGDALVLRALWENLDLLEGSRFFEPLEKAIRAAAEITGDHLVTEPRRIR